LVVVPHVILPGKQYPVAVTVTFADCRGWSVRAGAGLVVSAKIIIMLPVNKGPVLTNPIQVHIS
jgi:hypothetical protein